MEGLTRGELAVFRRFRRPAEIQDFLDTLEYRQEDEYFSPRSVLRERRAHCVDGSLFACVGLRLLGHPPRIVDLLIGGEADEHLLAVFQLGGLWGAVAQSNFVGLRYRDPVYRTLRELALSYFPVYFNAHGEKVLRGYTVPLDLSRYDRYHWMTSEEHLRLVVNRIDHVRRFELFPKQAERHLVPVDERTFGGTGIWGASRRAWRRPRR